MNTNEEKAAQVPFTPHETHSPQNVRLKSDPEDAKPNPMRQAIAPEMDFCKKALNQLYLTSQARKNPQIGMQNVEKITSLWKNRNFWQTVYEYGLMMHSAGRDEHAQETIAFLEQTAFYLTDETPDPTFEKMLSFFFAGNEERIEILMKRLSMVRDAVQQMRIANKDFAICLDKIAANKKKQTAAARTESIKKRTSISAELAGIFQELKREIEGKNNPNYCISKAYAKAFNAGIYSRQQKSFKNKFYKWLEKE